MLIKTVKKITLNLSIILLFIFIFIVFAPKNNSNNKSTKQTNIVKILPYTLSNSSITYNTKVTSSSLPNISEEKILNRAKEMTEVKWTPKHNLEIGRAHV